MPYKNPEDKKAHDREYRKAHPEIIRAINAKRKDEDRDIWRKYWRGKRIKVQDLDRKNKIKQGLVYKKKTSIYS